MGRGVRLLPAAVMATLLGLVLRLRRSDWVAGDAARGHQEVMSRLRGPLGAEDPGVVETLRARYLLPPPPAHLPYNLSHRYDYTNRRLSHSFGWDFYHHYITHFFGEQRGGFFLEAGALDGEFLSNTLWLEQTLAWTGLLVEADANNFRHLFWKRRRAWISNTCIAKEPYPREAIFESLDKAAGQRLGWIYRANTREVGSYFTRFLDELSGSSRRSYSRTQCFPLPTYLMALNITTIDLLSLDMQGGEWQAIRSLPRKVLVRSMAVEHFPEENANKTGTKFDHDFVRYMEGVGYRLVDVNKDVDYFFILKSDQRLKHKSDPNEINRFQEKLTVK